MNQRKRPAGRRVGLLGRALVVVLAVVMAPVLPTLAAATEASTLGVVNINTASADELQLLPGVGPVRAQAILAERKHRGGYKRIEGLAEVRGIGESMLEKLRPHVILTGRTTARLNPDRSRSAPAGGH